MNVIMTRKPAEILPQTYILAIFRKPTANLPITHRKRSANHPTPYRGCSLGSHPHGGLSLPILVRGSEVVSP